mgnify:CR=1 FL=1
MKVLIPSCVCVLYVGHLLGQGGECWTFIRVFRTIILCASRVH